MNYFTAIITMWTVSIIFCFKTTALSAKFVSMSITYSCYIGYKCAVCYLMPSIIFFSVPFSM